MIVDRVVNMLFVARNEDVSSSVVAEISMPFLDAHVRGSYLM